MHRCRPPTDELNLVPSNGLSVGNIGGFEQYYCEIYESDDVWNWSEDEILTYWEGQAYTKEAWQSKQKAEKHFCP